MSALDSWPLSLSGHALAGDRWVKQIHVDEAGTSRKEPKAVVGAILIDGDRHFRPAEERIASAIERHIPEHLRDGFVFHAKDVFGKHKRAEGWDLEKCYEITEAWIAIIADLRIPWVAAWATKTLRQGDQFAHAQNVVSHALAFTMCFQTCDELVAKHSPNDIASVIAEDCPQMKAHLKTVIRAQVAGEMRHLASLFERPITHIKNAVQFCDKADAVLLQLADVCAYSFKRYVTGSPGGERLFHALVGNPQFILKGDNPQADAGVFGWGWRSTDW